MLCRTCTSAASTGKQHCLSFNVTFQEVGVHLPNPVSHTSKHPKIGVSSHQDQDPQVTMDFNTKIYKNGLTLEDLGIPPFEETSS